MKLKQEDRELFRAFFTMNKSWIEGNSLNVEENLLKLKILFVNYMEEENQSENLSFMIFILMLDQEIIESKKQVLVRNYQNKINRNLNYIPICRPLTDNNEILSWIKQANIIHEVSRTDIEILGKSVAKKIKQNENERNSSCEAAKNIIVK